MGIFGKKGGSKKKTTEISTSLTMKDFDLLKVLGKGSFGKVMLVKKKDTGEVMALKSLRKQAVIASNQLEHTKTERALLAQMDHPFIVGLRYAFQSEDKLYLVLDYVPGGEIFFHLKQQGQFPPERARLYAAEIAAALAHVHSIGVVYRDLKPENILLDRDGHLKITDFGLAKEVPKGGGKAETICGTPEYMAPEILTGVGHDHSVDWWSLGTLLYEMLTGLPPFYSENVNEMYDRILNEELKFPAGMSEDTKSFLRGLLTRDPSARLGSGPNGSVTVQNHPYFKDIDWNKLLEKGYTPDFKPKISGDATTAENFDEEFTSEKAVDSVVESHLGNTHKPENQFEGFTFTGDSALK